MIKHKEVKKMFKRGIQLLSDNKAGDALQVFEEGLGGIRKDKDKGPFLYNIAVCQTRLGRTDEAVESLDRAISFQPSIVSGIRRDKDFDELRSTESFRQLQQKHKGRFIRTDRWYLVWFLFAVVLGCVVSVSTGQDPVWVAGKFGGVSIVFAWLAGKLVEGVFAFKSAYSKIQTE